MLDHLIKLKKKLMKYHKYHRNCWIKIKECNIYLVIVFNLNPLYFVFDVEQYKKNMWLYNEHFSGTVYIIDWKVIFICITVEYI